MDNTRVLIKIVDHYVQRLMAYVLKNKVVTHHTHTYQPKIYEKTINS